MSSLVFYGHLLIEWLATQQGPPPSCPVGSNGYWVSCQWEGRASNKGTRWWCCWWGGSSSSDADLHLPYWSTDLTWRQTRSNMWPPPATTHLCTLTWLFIMWRSEERCCMVLYFRAEEGSSIRLTILHPEGDDAIWEQCNYFTWSHLGAQAED